MRRRPVDHARVPESPPAGLAERVATAAAPELGALARRARRRTALAAALLAAPLAVIVWQLARAGTPASPAPRADAQWLAGCIGPDGRFLVEGEPVPPEVGLHGLALLALVRGGGPEPEAAALERAADWLLRQQGADGALAPEDEDHALGLLALVEAWRATGLPRLRDGAVRAHANLLAREAWGRSKGVAAAAWSLEALLCAREAGLDEAAAADRRARERLVAQMGGPVERGKLRQAALSPRAAPRQEELGPVYRTAVSMLAAAWPDEARF